MQNFNYQTKSYKTTSSTLYDEGLRQYFLKIYALMSTGLAIAAFSVLSVPLLTNMMFNIAPGGYLVGMTSIGWLITFAPLGISLYFAFGLDRISTQNAQMLFWVYATLIGMSLASLGFVYTGASITKTFLICSAMFGGMSLYGYSTKKDLTSMGSFLFMGLIGLVIASLINILFRSPAIEFALSFLGVLIFTGLIAYDTQKLKSLYYQGADTDGKIGIMAAFTLYLDFINLFIYLLRFFGEKINDKER
jgi:FtsH-binding integral membrane protein